ncbi:MAG: hypothetical protein ABIK65_06655 [Candidatus Eisenbacteria bacterium]
MSPNTFFSGGSLHLDEDACLDLIHGLLTGSDAETAISHMGGCADCENRFRAMAAERERLRATRRLRSRDGGEISVEKLGRGVPLPEEEAERTEPAPLPPAGRNRRPRYYLAGGAAAAAMILFLILSPFREAPPDRGDLRWLPPLSGELDFRAPGDGADDADLDDGLAAYEDRDLSRAVDLLERAEVSGTLGMIRDVYLGSARAWRGENDRAIEILSKVPAEILPDPWGSEARWTLYLAYGRSGAETAADSLLHLLAEEGGEVGDRARGVRSVAGSRP